MSSDSIEAKIVVVGVQGVGKTCLVNRFIHQAFAPSSATPSTIGASFLTKRVVDVDTGTTVRLQIWDTAGQERFRSISKLYYRGANAAILCYDITSQSSFTEMGHWLEELQENLPEDTVLHLVGTKADMVTEDPTKRAIAFETCVAYAAEHLYPASQNSAAPGAANASLTPNAASRTGSGAHASLANLTNVGSPHSNRSSMGFWGLDLGWDSCHEVSASSGEGVEEVFRVITRRLVEQRAARSEIEREMLDDDEDEEERREGQRSGNGRGGGPRRTARDWAGDGAGHPYGAGGGSFRVGIGDKRRSWLGLPQFPGATEAAAQDGSAPRRRGPCCGG